MAQQDDSEDMPWIQRIEQFIEDLNDEADDDPSFATKRPAIDPLLDALEEILVSLREDYEAGEAGEDDEDG